MVQTRKCNIRFEWFGYAKYIECKSVAWQWNISNYELKYIGANAENKHLKSQIHFEKPRRLDYNER